MIDLCTAIMLFLQVTIQDKKLYSNDLFIKQNKLFFFQDKTRMIVTHRSGEPENGGASSTIIGSLIGL